MVVFSKGRVIYPDIITFVEFSTFCWFRRILRTLLIAVLCTAGNYKGQGQAKGACVWWCVCVVCVCVCVCARARMSECVFV